jgi:hypothetical protein
MARIPHGERVSLDAIVEARKDIESINTEIPGALAHSTIPEFTAFNYLFPNLQEDPANLLPDKDPAATVENLKKLGETMRDSGDNSAFDSALPAAYTYFGQFVDHDITLIAESADINLEDSELKPLTVAQAQEKIKNVRTPTLDLDPLYGATLDGTPVPRRCGELLLGTVSPSGNKPTGKDSSNDLPRKEPMLGQPKIDRAALIGDPRNDENLIISQLHVAFIRAHRNLIQSRMDFDEAKQTLIQHYQWLIIHDFLRKIADTSIVDDILMHGNRIFRPKVCEFYMPLEFSAAAYRFGHSMVRSKYNYNVNFNNETAATLGQLFAATRFAGKDFEEFATLPEKWIIDWERFLTTNSARQIDTRMVEPLLDLPDQPGTSIKKIKNLAVRNLLRGYLLRMPVGQRVAEAISWKPLSPKEISSAAANEAQLKILRDAGFLERTPLWFYILAEATGRNELGPVGSTIVAEVLIGLVRWSKHSILKQPEWKPTLGPRPGQFFLRNFFEFAGVWK